MAYTLKNFLNRPLIVILGSTGTGKSKLGIELAKKVNGEIISADSMQVYKGLDIITNKVTDEEQNKIPHHLINIIKPPLEFSVKEYKKKALDVIQELFTEKKVPIIVGGTYYYIESLLWNFLIDDSEEEEEEGTPLLDETEVSDKAASHTYQKDLSLFEKLKAVDPERAATLHPNNIRKISRSLDIFYKTGKKHSELLEEQKACHGSSKLGGPLRFQNVLVFCLTCKQEVLTKRLCDRADSMLEKGLVKEISDFYESYKREKYEGRNVAGNSEFNKDSDTLYEEGLFQAIGFKEFHDYFTSNLDNEDRDHLLQEGLNSLKRVTVKYSKKQKCWINNRFLGRSEESSLNVYELDTTDINSWETNVYQRALKIAEEFLSNSGVISFKPMMRKVSNANPNTKYMCDICGNKVIMGKNCWQQHLTSRRHRRSLKRKREIDLESNEKQ